MGVTRERMTILKVQYDPKYTKEEDPSSLNQIALKGKVNYEK